MMKNAAAAAFMFVLAGLVLALVILAPAFLSGGGDAQAAHGAGSVGVIAFDMEPTGNTATSLVDTDDSIFVTAGTLVEVDIVVGDGAVGGNQGIPASDTGLVLYEMHAHWAPSPAGTPAASEGAMPMTATNDRLQMIIAAGDSGGGVPLPGGFPDSVDDGEQVVSAVDLDGTVGGGGEEIGEGVLATIEYDTTGLSPGLYLITIGVPGDPTPGPKTVDGRLTADVVILDDTGLIPVLDVDDGVICVDVTCPTNSDLSIDSQVVSAPPSSPISPTTFGIDVDLTVSNVTFGGVEPTIVDSEVTSVLTLPGDCSVASTSIVTAAGLLTEAAAATVLPTVTFTVDCTDTSGHAFSVTSTIDDTQGLVPDPVSGNDSETDAVAGGVDITALVNLGLAPACNPLVAEPPCFADSAGPIAPLVVDVGSDVKTEVTITKLLTNAGPDGPVPVNLFMAAVGPDVAPADGTPECLWGVDTLGTNASGGVAPDITVTDSGGFGGGPIPFTFLTAPGFLPFIPGPVPNSPAQGTGDIAGITLSLLSGQTAVVTETWMGVCLLPTGGGATSFMNVAVPVDAAHATDPDPGPGAGDDVQVLSMFTTAAFRPLTPTYDVFIDSDSISRDPGDPSQAPAGSDLCSKDLPCKIGHTVDINTGFTGVGQGAIIGDESFAALPFVIPSGTPGIDFLLAAGGSVTNGEIVGFLDGGLYISVTPPHGRCNTGAFLPLFTTTGGAATDIFDAALPGEGTGAVALDDLTTWPDDLSVVAESIRAAVVGGNIAAGMPGALAVLTDLHARYVSTVTVGLTDVAVNVLVFHNGPLTGGHALGGFTHFFVLGDQDDDKDAYIGTSGGTFIGDSFFVSNNGPLSLHDLGAGVSDLVIGDIIALSGVGTGFPVTGVVADAGGAGVDLVTATGVGPVPAGPFVTRVLTAAGDFAGLDSTDLDDDNDGTLDAFDALTFGSAPLTACTPFTTELTFGGETDAADEFIAACKSDRPAAGPAPFVMAFAANFSPLDGGPVVGPVTDINGTCAGDTDGDGIPDANEPSPLCNVLSEDADGKDTEGCPDTDQSVTDAKFEEVAVGSDGTPVEFDVTIDVTNGDYGSSAALLGTGATDVAFDVTAVLTPPASCTALWVSGSPIAIAGGGTATATYTTSALDVSGVDSNDVTYSLACTGTEELRTATPMVSISTVIASPFTGVDHEGAPSGTPLGDAVAGNFVDDDTTNDITVAVVPPICMPDPNDVTVCILPPGTTIVANSDPQFTKAFDVIFVVQNGTGGTTAVGVDIRAITEDPCAASWDASSGSPVAIDAGSTTNKIGINTVAEGSYTTPPIFSLGTHLNTVTYDEYCTAIPVPNPSNDQPFLSAATDPNTGANSEHQAHVLLEVLNSPDGIDDNCPYVSNPGQQDADIVEGADGGNACDDNDDNDTSDGATEILDGADDCSPGDVDSGGTADNLDNLSASDLQAWQEDIDGNDDTDGCREVDVDLNGGGSTVDVIKGQVAIHSTTITVDNHDTATATDVDVLIQATSDTATGTAQCQVHIVGEEVDQHGLPTATTHISVKDNSVDIPDLAPQTSVDIDVDFEVLCAEQGQSAGALGASIVFSVEAEPPVIDPVLNTGTAPCTDVNTCNDLLTINAKGEADLEATAITHDIPANIDVNDFVGGLTATLEYINNGAHDIPLADFDTSITIDPDAECEVSGGGAGVPLIVSGGATTETEDGVADSILSKNETGSSDAFFDVICTQPSDHSFEVSGTITIINTTEKVDTNLGNNDISVTKAVEVLADADLEVSNVEVIAPPSADINTTFQVSVEADVDNFSGGPGTLNPANGDLTLTLTGPGDCTLTPAGSQTLEDLAVGNLANQSKTWDVQCSVRSNHQFNGTASIVLDDGPHVSDPNTSNNGPTGVGVATPDSTGIAEESDLGVSASVTDGPTPATINVAVSNTATFEVTAESSNAGPATNVATDTTISASVVTPPPGGCTVSAGPAAFNNVLGPDASDAHTFTVTCTPTPSTTPSSVTVKGSAGIVDTETHISDPNGANDNDDTADVIITIIEDRDGDGIDRHVDNCNWVSGSPGPGNANYNPDQADNDGDGIGDVCDSDGLHDVRVKPNFTVFGPAPVVIGDATGSYTWIVGEIGNDQGSGHTEQVNVSLSVDGVPSGCEVTGDTTPVLPPASTLNILDNEQKPVVYRVNIEDGNSDCAAGQYTLTITLLIEHVDTSTGDECKSVPFDPEETADERGTTTVLCSTITSQVSNNSQVTTKQLLVVN